MIALEVFVSEDAPVREPRTFREAAFYNAGALAVLRLLSDTADAVRPRSANVADVLHDFAGLSRALLIYRNDESGLCPIGRIGTRDEGSTITDDPPAREGDHPC